MEGNQVGLKNLTGNIRSVVRDSFERTEHQKRHSYDLGMILMMKEAGKLERTVFKKFWNKYKSIRNSFMNSRSSFSVYAIVD